MASTGRATAMAMAEAVLIRTASASAIGRARIEATPSGLLDYRITTMAATERNTILAADYRVTTLEVTN